MTEEVLRKQRMERCLGGRMIERENNKPLLR